MKYAFVALAAAAVVTAPASALTYFSIPGASDPGLAVGEHLLLDFNSAALPAGVTETTTGSTGLFTGLTSGHAAPPAGDTTQYFAVGPYAPGSATFNFTGFFTGKHVRTISIYLGSLDTYNSLSILKTDGTVLATLTGSQIYDGSTYFGDQFHEGTNRRLYINFDPSEHVGGLTFSSTSPAFEFDDIAVSALKFAPTATIPVSGMPPIVGGGSTSLVPEPAAWGLMIGGFALTGLTARRRRTTVAA